MIILGRISINLVASLLQGLIGLALIPLVTLILGPRDYGVYGLASTVVALVASACETGLAFILYGHFHALDEFRRARLQSTLLAMALMMGLLGMAGLFSIWSILTHYIPLLSDLTRSERWLLCFTLPLVTTWSIVNPILIIRQQSAWLSASLLLQSLAGALTILTCLYLFQIGRPALFWGQWLGMSVSLVFSIALLGRSAWAPLDLSYLRQVVVVAPGAWFARLLESAKSTLESALIVKSVSGEALGIYNHARSYQALLTQGTNSFANVLWPIALKEAQTANTRFARIRTTWDFVYVGLACAGVGAVFFGHEMVSALTHGKFIQAGGWLPWLVVCVLLQNAGKPATARLYAAKMSNLYSSIRMLTMTIALVGLYILVPDYGVEAVLAVAIAEMLILRVCLGVAARRIGIVPFQDQWVIIGCLIIMFCWYVGWSFELSLAERYVAAVGLWSILLSGLYLWVRKTRPPDWQRSLLGQEV